MLGIEISVVVVAFDTSPSRELQIERHRGMMMACWIGQNFFVPQTFDLWGIISLISNGRYIYPGV